MFTVPYHRRTGDVYSALFQKKMMLQCFTLEEQVMFTLPCLRRAGHVHTASPQKNRSCSQCLTLEDHVCIAFSQKNIFTVPCFRKMKPCLHHLILKEHVHTAFLQMNKSCSHCLTLEECVHTALPQKNVFTLTNLQENKSCFTMCLLKRIFYV